MSYIGDAQAIAEQDDHVVHRPNGRTTGIYPSQGDKITLRILLTGSRGMLGARLLSELSRAHSVHPATRGDADITSLSAVRGLVGTVKPDIVIHPAAMADVDACEVNPDLAWKTNAIGVQNVALACEESGASLLYVSTDYVFGGDKGNPYIEFDRPGPINAYGHTKLAGEYYATTLCPRHYVVRVSWLFGGGSRGFLVSILNGAKERDTLHVVDDQTGTPTFIGDVAGEIGRLIATGAFGLYHMAGHGVCTRYEFARRILEVAGVTGVTVVPVTSEDAKRPAPRPRNTALSNHCLALTIGDRMQDWEDALGECLRNA